MKNEVICHDITGKYHKYVAVCIVTSVHNANCNKRVIFIYSVSWYYGDDDTITCSDVHVTFST